MNRFACVFLAVGLAAAGTTALAAPPKSQPVMMTDAQMDDVAAGSLTLIFNNSLNNWTIGDGLFIVNFIANVNTAIAGGDATAGQVVGTQTITVGPTPTQTVTVTAAKVHGNGK